MRTLLILPFLALSLAACSDNADSADGAGGAVPEALAFAAFFDNYDQVVLVPKGVRPH